MLARPRHRLRVEGTPRRACLIAVNHVSWLDIMAIHAVAPRRASSRRPTSRRWPLVAPGRRRRHALHRARAQARRPARRPRGRRGAARRRASRSFPKARPPTGTACCRSTPTCCRRRSRPRPPVQPVALRFSDAAPRSARRSSSSADDASSKPLADACGDGVARTHRVPGGAAGVDRREVSPRCSPADQRLLRARHRLERSRSLPTSADSSRRPPASPASRPPPPPAPLPPDRRGSSCGSASARPRARRRAGCRSGC